GLKALLTRRRGEPDAGASTNPHAPPSRHQRCGRGEGDRPGRGRADRRPRAPVSGHSGAPDRGVGRAAALHQYLRERGRHPVPVREGDRAQGRRRGLDRPGHRGGLARAVMAKMRVHLTFPPERIKEPVIYQLGRDFGLVTNIRKADVTATHGWVTLEIEGKDDDLERGVAWLKKQGLKVDPIEGDVIAP